MRFVHASPDSLCDARDDYGSTLVLDVRIGEHVGARDSRARCSTSFSTMNVAPWNLDAELQSDPQTIASLGALWASPAARLAISADSSWTS